MQIIVRRQYFSNFHFEKSGVSALVELESLCIVDVDQSSYLKEFLWSADGVVVTREVEVEEVDQVALGGS